jgi:hypothetical protein
MSEYVSPPLTKSPLAPDVVDVFVIDAAYVAPAELTDKGIVALDAIPMPTLLA